MRLVRALLPAALACVLACTTRAATWDMPSPYPDDDFRTVSAQAFAGQVAAASAGGLTLVVFGNGSLIGHDQIDAAVRGNRVPIGLLELARLGDGASVFAFSSLPFLAATYTDALQLWTAARPVVRRLAADRGLMVLYALPSPPAALFSRQPIARVEDLAGAPLAAADPWLRRLASDIGARPLELADADLPRLFGPGSGGQPPPRAALLAPFTAAVRVEAWRRLGHAYDVQASFPLAVVAVNQQAFYALDEASQRALLNAAVDAQNAAWRGSIDERNARVAELGERNLVVQPPAAALQDGLAQAGARLVGEWLNAAGPDGQAILAAYRAGGP